MAEPVARALCPTPVGDKPRPICRHCGAALIDARMRETGFCCAGCSYVFRLVHEHGLAGYYRLKDEVTAPADAAVFQPRDYGWLEAAQREAEGGARSPGEPGFQPAHRSATQAGSESRPYLDVPELTLGLQGISCAGCVWLIERIFQQAQGARDIVVNAQYGTMRLRWSPGEFSAAEFARRLQALGYLTGPAGGQDAEPESRGLAKRLGLCAAFALNVMLFAFPTYFGMEPSFEYARLFGLLALGFGTLSVLVGGGYFIGRAVQAAREGALHIDQPIAIGIVGAYAGSLYGWLAGEERFVYFDFVSAFIVLMLIGRWAQVAAVERNRRRLLAHQPRPAPVLLDDGTAVPPEQVLAGQRLVLAAGQMLPVEARLAGEAAAFSFASINGEAEPRVFRNGQRVPAGAVNLGRAACRLEALQPWAESLLARLLAPAERTRDRRGLLEQIVQGYLIGILAIAALAGAGWWLATGDALRAGAVVTAVLVVSCPCAIGLAFPLADEIATVALRRRGVFVRDGGLWARLGRVRKIVFDKTGTLTLETPVLRNPAALRALAPAERAALFTLVRDSLHPVSQCLLENLLGENGTETAIAGDVRETVGHGVECGPWSLGRAGWRAGEAGEGGTIFAWAGRVLARFDLADTARADARDEIGALRARGLEVFILSGDHAGKVGALAREIGLPADHARGGLAPQAKADWLGRHAADDALMLGDGANDSLAFDRALCRGTPVVHRGVLEGKADFYWLGRGIGGIRALFEVDTVRRRTQRAILVFSITYNLTAVGLAVAGRMNPLLAAVLMPVNSLLTLALVSWGMAGVFARREAGKDRA
ncbi:MAG: heavy metal translocating P-type ATPase metal-binding domain-containing protein [Opitutaceae bacterium]|nr:heavy metal translocating P-type ATPase metal-binding domain-containing protein [Opitutaceae bacterium]